MKVFGGLTLLFSELYVIQSAESAFLEAHWHFATQWDQISSDKNVSVCFFCFKNFNQKSLRERESESFKSKTPTLNYYESGVNFGWFHVDSSLIGGGAWQPLRADRPQVASGFVSSQRHGPSRGGGRKFLSFERSDGDPQALCVWWVCIEDDRSKWY